MSLLLVSSIAACGGRQETETPMVEEEAAPMSMLALIHSAGAPRATAFLGDAELGALAGGASTDLTEVPAGSWTLSIRAADGETELASERVTLTPEMSYVGIVGGTTENLFLTLLSDEIPTPAAGTSFVRFVNSLNGPVTVSAGDRQLASDLGSGAFTNYTQMTPESYRFEATSGDMTGGVSVSVNPNMTYLVIPYYNGTEIAFVVKSM
jgi:hypothetical protein